MTFTKQTDQVAQAAALLLQQFHEHSPNLQALLASYTAQVQELENVFADLFTMRTLAAATGAQLDGLGRIVSLVRDGRDDATYRLALTTKILILRNSCTMDEINAIISNTIADTYTWTTKLGPTSVDIDFSSDVGDTPTPVALAKILRLFIAAGVRCVIAWNDSFVALGDGPFSFGPSADFEGFTKGLGNAAGTTGGYFIRASDGEVKESMI